MLSPRFFIRLKSRLNCEVGTSLSAIFGYPSNAANMADAES